MLGEVAKDDTLELPAPAGVAPPKPRALASGRTRVGWSLPDIAGAGLLALCVLVVHDVGYMFTKPFWNDEAWVAVSTRAPLGSLPWMTSSTPLGFTLLLRLAPGGSWLRVVPLIFTMAAVAAAWWFGRELPLPRFTPLLTGLAALLVPAMLVRDDLKQYTAEAFTAVVLLALVARVENEWSRRRLAAIVVFTPVAMLFANSATFVGVAAIGALGVEPLVRRDWRRVKEVCVAAAAMAVLAGAVFAAIDLRNINPDLTRYWSHFYVPTNRGLGGAWTYVRQHVTQIARALGWKRVAVDAGMALIGIITLVRLRRHALALMVPLTLLLVVAASMARKYPFGDVRTSTFWLVMVALLMAVGVAGIVDLVRKRASPAAAAVVLVAAVFLWVTAARPFMRTHLIANLTPQNPSGGDVHEDVRSQVHYLEAHRRPGDVVVIDLIGAWGFAYYDHKVTPSFRHFTISWGFIPTYPKQPWIVQMTSLAPRAIPAALSEAQHRLGPLGRIWIVRSLVLMPEGLAWARTLQGKDVTTIPVGPEPLLLYRVHQ